MLALLINAFDLIDTQNTLFGCQLNMVDQWLLKYWVATPLSLVRTQNSVIPQGVPMTPQQLWQAGAWAFHLTWRVVVQSSEEGPGGLVISL